MIWLSKYRLGRVNEEFKRQISYIIQNELRDPRIDTMISVTSVEVSKDLKYAKVFVSIFGNDESKNTAFEILKSSSGFVRKELSQKVNMRYTPEIVFKMDDSIEHGMHIDSIINKIKEKEKNEWS